MGSSNVSSVLTIRTRATVWLSNARWISTNGTWSWVSVGVLAFVTTWAWIARSRFVLHGVIPWITWLTYTLSIVAIRANGTWRYFVISFSTSWSSDNFWAWETSRTGKWFCCKNMQKKTGMYNQTKHRCHRLRNEEMELRAPVFDSIYRSPW